MTTYSAFDVYDVGTREYELGVLRRGEGEATFKARASALFESPPLENGDTFDLLTALSNAPDWGIDVSQSGFNYLNQADFARAVIIDSFLEVVAEGATSGGSFYHGSPPRQVIGSYTVEVNDVITEFEFINYRRQSIGRRMTLLDRRYTDDTWGVELYRVSYYDLSLWELTHFHKLNLYINPNILYDENESADPPLPPNMIPLTCRLRGRIYIVYFANYDYGVTFSNGVTVEEKTTVRSDLSSSVIPYGVGWEGGSIGVSV